MLGTLGGNSDSLIHQDFKFYKHAITALKKTQKNEFKNIIITNQSHIAHGRVTLDEYENAINRLLDELSTYDIEIEKVYTCPHKRLDGCSCKKPLPYFINKAINQFDLDKHRSYIIGDSGKNDILMAKRIDMKSVLVLTGEGETSLTRDTLKWGKGPDFIATNSLDAINQILEYELLGGIED